MPEEPPEPAPQLMLEDLQPAPPAPQPAPEEPPEPDPQPVSTTTGPAPVAPVRAHATQSVHSTPVSHPLGQTSTVYRAETLEPATAPRTAGSWETVEYNLQLGLGLIRASTGYAARTTGRPGGGGVTIAIVGRRIPVDDGESIGHYDLEGVTQARIFTSHPPAPDLDHETVVAGAAAARRNGLGAHGVAYNANIVSVPQSSASTRFRTHVLGWDMEAILASTAGLSRSYYSSFGGNFRSNPAASAHVANLSLFVAIGFSLPTLRGMRHMAQAGRVMVTALGNDGKPNPSFPPATLVGREGIAGHAIAVGALNGHGTGAHAHSFTWSSTRCGNVKRWCIFAPGVRIYTTFGQYHNRARRDHAYASGTSVAAPHVAGAVAAVWAAFPNKTGAQIVQRILDTARQVDIANGNYDPVTGLSPIYGHGALDLGAAMNPVGFTSLLTRGSGAIPVRQSFVSLPPGFRHRPTAALRDAIVYDTQTFPFLHDLNGAIRTQRAPSATSAVEDFLSPSRYGQLSKRLGGRVQLGFAWSKQDRADRDPEIRDYRLRVAATPALSLRFARGSGARSASNDFVARRLGRGLFRDGFVVEPFTALTGDGTAFGVDWRRDEDTRLDFVGKAGSGYFGGGRARLASLGVTRRFGTSLTLSARYGALRERGSLLGIRGSGAFRDDPGAHTDFLDLGVERRTASGAVFFGSVGRGLTKSAPAGAGSLISGWSGGRGESFAFGGEWPGLWRDSDRLTLLASSPFRPRGAGVYVDVPDRELADGVVAYTRHWVNLSPRGRELRLQLVYEAETAPGAALILGGLLRLNPDHDPEAAPQFGAAARLRVDF